MQGIVISVKCMAYKQRLSELTTMYDNSIIPTELDITATAGEPYMIETLGGVKGVKT